MMATDSFVQLGQQPIHYACDGGHLSVVNELIKEHGVKSYTTDLVIYRLV